MKSTFIVRKYFFRKKGGRTVEGIQVELPDGNVNAFSSIGHALFHLVEMKEIENPFEFLFPQETRIEGKNKSEVRFLYGLNFTEIDNFYKVLQKDLHEKN